MVENNKIVFGDTGFFIRLLDSTMNCMKMPLRISSIFLKTILLSA